MNELCANPKRRGIHGSTWANFTKWQYETSKSPTHHVAQQSNNKKRFGSDLSCLMRWWSERNGERNNQRSKSLSQDICGSRAIRVDSSDRKLPAVCIHEVSFVHTYESFILGYDTLWGVRKTVWGVTSAIGDNRTNEQDETKLCSQIHRNKNYALS